MLKAKYTSKDFIPLTMMLALVLVASLVWTAMTSGDAMRWMELFMGLFFILFGGLKASNLREFVSAYKMYDVLAMRSTAYAYAYPFIELALGILYLTATYPLATNAITFVVMLVSAWGVYRTLASGKEIMCACLGAVFKVPMTWVTLGEDVLMAGMAGYMLLVSL
jgi:hypothetical protein